MLVLPALAVAFEGPLNIKNSHPLFLATGSPSLSSALPEDAVQIAFTYSSTFMNDRSKDWFFGVDLETAILDIQISKVIGDSTEISMDLPLISYNSGFLDGFLKSYHRSFGFPDYGRSERPDNEFLFRVASNNRKIVQGRSGEIVPGDMKIGIKKAFRLDDPVMAVQGFLNLPTGNPERGYGSGQVNGGAALLLNKTLGDKVISYFNAGLGITDKLRAKEDIKLRDYLYGGAGLEWACSERFLINGQLFLQQSPFKNTGVRDIDNGSSILSLGGRYRLNKKSALGFSFSEDPGTAGAPDFMIAIDYKYRF